MNQEVLEARGLVLAEMVQQEATIATLRARVAELEAALAEKTGEAERQYDYNVSQIARVTKLEAALKEIEFHGGPAADFARAALSETVEA